MTKDIRVAVAFPHHPKTSLLEKKLGVQGPWSLVCLWTYAAQYKADGKLTNMTNEEVGIAARWPGDPDEFISALLKVKFLDKDGDMLVIHDWQDHNPWAATAQKRSQVARANAKKRWDRERKKAGLSENPLFSEGHACKQHKDIDANSNAGSTADSMQGALQTVCRQHKGSNAELMQMACTRQCSFYATCNAPSPSPSPSPKYSARFDAKEQRLVFSDGMLKGLATQFPELDVNKEVRLIEDLTKRRPIPDHDYYEVIREHLVKKRLQLSEEATDRDEAES